MKISIHAPLRERHKIGASIRLVADFNPRSLAGATELSQNSATDAANFNPRSLAGATNISVNGRFSRTISIHAPLRERRRLIARQRGYGGISIHAPLRERHNDLKAVDTAIRISIHAPLRERQVRSSSAPAPKVFQSTLPCGSDAVPRYFYRASQYFNPRSLAEATCTQILNASI